MGTVVWLCWEWETAGSTETDNNVWQYHIYEKKSHPQAQRTHILLFSIIQGLRFCSYLCSHLRNNSHLNLKNTKLYQQKDCYIIVNLVYKQIIFHRRDKNEVLKFELEVGQSCFGAEELVWVHIFVRVIGQVSSDPQQVTRNKLLLQCLTKQRSPLVAGEEDQTWVLPMELLCVTNPPT